jgi:hypothetical protein
MGAEAVAVEEEVKFMTTFQKFVTSGLVFLFSFATLADESCGWRDPKLRFADGLESCLKRDTPFFDISGLIDNDSRTYYRVAQSSQMYSVAVVKDQNQCPFASGTAWNWHPTENPKKAIEFCEKKFPEALKRSCKCEIILDFWDTPLTYEQFKLKINLLTKQHLAGGTPLGVSNPSASNVTIAKPEASGRQPLSNSQSYPGVATPPLPSNAPSSPGLEIDTLASSAPLGNQSSQFSDPSNERRLALVIGNGSYRLSPLKNPKNDVRSMTMALSSAGFEVMAFEDLDFKGMRTAIREFGDKLTRYDVGLFYYSGHGVQVEGNNYLIPVDSDIRRVDEITTSSLNANFILAKMESAQNKLNLVVLDACRDTPLGGISRGLTRGLSSMDAAKGTMIAFSTAPGEVAMDGEGDNSPYTKHLSTAIQKKGLLLEQVFKEVRRNVVAETEGKQVPWENSSVMGDFYFLR